MIKEEGTNITNQDAIAKHLLPVTEYPEIVELANAQLEVFGCRKK